MSNYTKIEYTPDEYYALQQEVIRLAAEAKSIAQVAAEIAGRLHAGTEKTTEDAWAKAYGETVTKNQAAKINGVGVATINSAISEGRIALDPNGRVVVRSLARWTNSVPRVKARAKIFRVAP